MKRLWKNTACVCVSLCASVCVSVAKVRMELVRCFCSHPQLHSAVTKLFRHFLQEKGFLFSYHLTGTLHILVSNPV